MKRPFPGRSIAGWKSVGFAGAFLFLGLQVAPVPAPRTNPPVNLKLTIHSDPAVPAAVREVLERSCMNCHSNATQWPWYSRVAPASWLVANDVTKARKALNFSEWGALKLPVRAALAAAVCENVRTGRMPLPRYLVMHPGARLDQADKDVLCIWSQEVLQSLARPKSLGRSE